MPATSPAKTLSLILHGPARTANPDIVLLDYRDPATFSALWLQVLESGQLSIGEQQIDLTDSTKQFLLIGNDPPDGVFDTRNPALAGINFRSHFTASSWLAAWKVKFPNAQARMAVIDVREAGAGGGAARALETILAARDSFGRPLVPRASVLNAPGLEAICHWLHESKTDNRATPPQISDLLKTSIWNELTSVREQHHALSNVLGAFLLSSQVAKGAPHPGDPWAQDFLLTLVRACGIEAALHQVKLKEYERFQGWVTTEQQTAIQGVVFIDDMGDLWEYFLRGALGFAGEAAFGATDRSFRECLEVFGKGNFAEEIAALPRRLTAFFQSRKALLTAGDLLGRESKLSEQFTLFLDLRLFPGRTNGRPDDSGVQFYQQLAEFGIMLLDSKRNLPWARYETRDSLRKELEQCINSTPPALDQSGLPPRETILPRLVSLLDPTLPIVVFSSTRHTELIEPFRNYGNIITAFHKPVLTGLAGDWPEKVREMHAGFILALDQAVRILRVRQVLRPFYKPMQAN